MIGGRYRLIKYVQSGSFKHGWKALDIQRRVGGEFPAVFLATLKPKEDTIGGKTIAKTALQVNFTLARLHACTLARCGGRSGRDRVGIGRCWPWPLLDG